MYEAATPEATWQTVIMKKNPDSFEQPEMLVVGMPMLNPEKKHIKNIKIKKELKVCKLRYLPHGHQLHKT